MAKGGTSSQQGYHVVMQRENTGKQNVSQGGHPLNTPKAVHGPVASPKYAKGGHGPVDPPKYASIKYAKGRSWHYGFILNTPKGGHGSIASL